MQSSVITGAVTHGETACHIKPQWMQTIDAYAVLENYLRITSSKVWAQKFLLLKLV